VKKNKSSPLGKQLSAQVKAIRRRMRDDDYAGARSRLLALRAAHPKHKSLLGLAWELEDTFGEDRRAALAALDWTRASPASLMAWEALNDSANRTGMLALAVESARRYGELEEGCPQDEPPDSDAPFGLMPFAEMVANDTARLLMGEARFDEAIAVLSQGAHPSSRNNVALCLFYRGKVQESLAEAEAVWPREPRNLVALGLMVRLRLWTRGMDLAAGLAAPLKTTPIRPDDAVAQMYGLLLLGQWEAAEHAWRESLDADFWDADGDDGLRERFLYTGGVAALRLGQRALARERFEAAAETETHATDAKELSLRLKWTPAQETPTVALGHLNEWFPHPYIQSLRALGADADEKLPAESNRLLMQCDAHPDYLGKVAELGGTGAASLGVMILQARADAADAAAIAELVSLLTRPCGPDSVRASIHQRLYERKQIEADRAIRMLTLGEVREVKHLAMTIHADPSPPRLPTASHERLEQAMDAVSRNDMAAARSILEALLEQHPEDASLHANLASVLEGLKHPDHELEPLYRRARELEPDYLFAAAGLARIAARRGDIDGCKALLDAIQHRDSYHFTEYRSVLMAQRQYALAQGEMLAAGRIEQAVADLQRRFA
jgi:Tfp pilus assembly protein PilF